MTGKLRNMASVYLLNKQQILLLYRQGKSIVNNLWVASAGGHFENDELNDAKSCALREMTEELGITEDNLNNLELRYITLRRVNGEIRINYCFFAQLQDAEDLNLKSNEGILKWFDFSELKDLEMPFTSKYMFEHYSEIGSANHKLYVGTANGESVEFVEMPEY